MVDTRFSVSIQIMMTLAYHAEELMNSEGLAKVLKTNPTFIRKLVSNLVEAELIESFRGKGGGIRIARRPETITLKEIYLASIEDKKLMSCHKKPVLKACPVSSCIEGVLDEVVEGIEASTMNFLAKKNLRDLLKNINT